MTTYRRRWQPLALATIIFLAACSVQGDKSSSNDAKEAQAKPAQVMTMARRDIALDKSYPAKLRSNRQAVVLARVQGLLEKRLFEPGQQVEKGDSLYLIEPTIYRATVNQRAADLQSAQAKAYQARRDAERAGRLKRNHAISAQEAEQTAAQKRVADAAVAQARAALESAKVDLGYTNVTAPVAGMISLSEVNVGNVVNAGSELATITPLNPLEVRFQLPQADGFDLRRQRQSRKSPISAVLKFPGLQGDAATLRGKLDFLGSNVSQGTSTIQAQAIFDNPGNLYLPGQFVRVRIEGMKRYSVFAVPEIAITQGLLGPQLFTLDKNNRAGTTNVTLGEEAGSQVIITDGLAAGDRVIVSDPGAIKAGMKIKPQTYDADAQGDGGRNADSTGNANRGERSLRTADPESGAHSTRADSGE